MILSKLLTRCMLSTLLCTGASAFAPAATAPAGVPPSPSALRAAAGDDGRRAFLATSAAALAAGLVAAPPAATAAAAGADYRAVAGDIAALVAQDPDKGPTLVRLAWHSSGTYDKRSKDGGSGPGTIRFAEELAHGGNAGLGATAVTWLEPLKRKYGTALSYADLYTLGGVVAIKQLGGPTIAWSSGRVDALDSSAVTPDGRLPNADVGPAGTDPDDAAHLRAVFGRMGFDDREIVALSGAHALGRCHAGASGFDGPWTPTPTTFNNLYFALLKTVTWTKRDWSGPFQYEDGGKRLMMLPTDYALVQDAKFKKYVDVYAGSQATFFADFAEAFQKLEELGTRNLVATQWA